MYSIHQVGDRWEVRDESGTALGEQHDTYALALAAIGELIEGALSWAAAMAAADGGSTGGDDEDENADNGLLPEIWEDVAGICFNQQTGDGRNFEECDWTWRDPNVSLLPLMLQTVNDVGHFAARLAGFMVELSKDKARVSSWGRFYDSETGREARDIVASGGRFGVSVDPGRYDLDWVCLEEDEDGWCVESEMKFTAYEIIGLTMTPFPGFAEAAIQIRGATNSVAASAALATPPPVASVRELGIPVAPPAAWLHEPEPELGDERLVEQDLDGNLAMPWTVTDDGQVMGHLAYWGQCHTGWEGVCVQPPASVSNYAQMHLGETVCAGGERIPTGNLVIGCDHADLSMFAAAARDHYANAGLQMSNVRVIDGVFGPWLSGALSPDITPEQLRIIRASCLSGDWRRLGGSLELIIGLAVNNPGFPIRREALVASGLQQVPKVRAQASYQGGVQQSLVASAMVTGGCTTCDEDRPTAGRRRSRDMGSGQLDSSMVEQLATMQRTLEVIERRTRHQVGDAARAAQQALVTTR